jgi:RNA polymerase sigma factor (sigma-70 family)
MPPMFSSPSLLHAAPEVDLPDNELLRRFVDGRDEAAFDGLMRRHGPMVLEVCRNVLGHEADAEDAFQATFLILARKAGAIRKQSSVGSWLYGVAYRTALKARSASAQRRRHETHDPKPASAETCDELTWREVRHVLHAELYRASERYRAPLVLCYLEGKTQDEAARLLGVTAAALKKRLERGREMLRSRLVRRGFGPAALLAAAAWPAAPASACPPALLSSTTHAATQFVAGHTVAGLVSVEAANLTQGVLKAMFLTKLRILAAVALCFALPLAGGVALLMHAASPPKDAAVDNAANADPAQGAGADQNPAPRKAAAANDTNGAENELKSLSGVWAKGDAKHGISRFNFDAARPGAAAFIGKARPVSISWIAPAGAARAPLVGVIGGGAGVGAGGLGGGAGGPGFGGPIGYGAGYDLKEKDGKKIIVFHLSPSKGDQQDVEASYSLDGDTLTLDGGVIEPGRRGDRPPLFTVELKGEWKRVNVDLENKLRRAFPGVTVETLAIKVDLRPQRLVIGASDATIQDGRIRLTDCVFARIPEGAAGAKATTPTAIRSEFALLTTANPVRSIDELAKSGSLTAVEFADGMRLSLQDR